jgi:hypothetical protein
MLTLFSFQQRIDIAPAVKHSDHPHRVHTGNINKSASLESLSRAMTATRPDAGWPVPWEFQSQADCRPASPPPAPLLQTLPRQPPHLSRSGNTHTAAEYLREHEIE